MHGSHHVVSIHRSLPPSAKKRGLANLRVELGQRIPRGGIPDSQIFIHRDGDDVFVIKRVREGNDMMGNVMLGFKDIGMSSK